ncbi:MAG: hypothetical protein JSS29_00565 [Proteobacteria bacterium]|nr:hypothetical protein [Pseudomonadota bacterium]
METDRRNFIAGAVATFIAGSLPARAAHAPAELTLGAGARIGIVNLVDAELTHYHAARHVQDGFLKTYPLSWSVAAMLAEALRDPLAALGLTGVALVPPESLRRAREACFLNANLEKALPRECVAPYGEVLASQKVQALIVLGPGLNDGTHAGGARRRELPEYLRGWCLASGEGEAQAQALNLTELILVAPGARGAQLLARVYGGSAPESPVAAPADPKSPTAQELEALRAVFAGLLARQCAALFAQVRLSPRPA